MKAKRTAQSCKKSATHAPVCRFSYYGLTFEVHGTSRELVDGVECDHGKLSVLVPQPNGLWEQAHFTVKLGDDAALIRSLNAVVGGVLFEQWLTKRFDQLDATAEGVRNA